MRPIRLKRPTAIVLSIILSIFLLELSLRTIGGIYLRLSHPLEPIKEELRAFNILCLGDSFTEGFGASKGKSYPEQLQEIANGQLGKTINVHREFRINSSTILKYLKKDINKYRADLLIIMTGCNDTWSLQNCNYLMVKDGNLLEKTDVLLGDFRIYKFAKITLLNLKKIILSRSLQFNQDNKKGNSGFKSQEAERHYILGDDYMRDARYELALSEFKQAEQLEPDNPDIHLRLAHIYLQIQQNYALAKDEAMSALRHGDSSILQDVFAVVRDSTNLGDKNQDERFYAAIKDMESVIEDRNESNEKVEAKKYLEQLLSFHRDNKIIGKVIAYNLKEITKLAKQKKIKVVLMQYPFGVVPDVVRETIQKMSDLNDIPLVDNYALFKNRLEKLKRSDLFAEDGHCNQYGYNLIAKNVYKSLILNKFVPIAANVK
ncbi:GDSL-type esterase/lipase family protein [Candidatus Omnitrophota bacterium]